MMKTTHLTLLAALLLSVLTACERTGADSQEQAPDTSSKPNVAGASTPTSSSRHPLAKATATPTPRGPRPAPPGVFYLKERISITTDSGVVGVPPGAEVKLISKAPPKVKVKTKSGVELTLQERQLTNDLNEAEDIAQADRKRQEDLLNAHAKR